MIVRHDERGQTLVIAALAMVALLLSAGLVVDGGWAFANQRGTQNAMDAAADAGAVVLVQNLPARAAGQTGTKTDADVLAQVTWTAQQNGVTNPLTAEYTDILGKPIGVQVGSRPVPPPTGAFGVQVTGSIEFGTFFAGIAGMTHFTASAVATAVAGAVTGLCGSDEPCDFIPVTFPIELTDCENNGQQTTWGSGGAYSKTTTFTGDTEVIIPLCGTTAGSVGWLDIQPHNPDCNGQGAGELACNILSPNHDPFDIPIWMEARTGNTNTVLVQDALNTKTGNIVGTYEPGLDQYVYIPLYDCLDNGIGQVSPGPDCPPQPVTGVGNLTSYHIVGLGVMILDHAYIQANNPECNEYPGLGPYAGGNGENGCLKGWITDVLTASGQVSWPGDSRNSVFGVQLVR